MEMGIPLRRVPANASYALTGVELSPLRDHPGPFDDARGERWEMRTTVVPESVRSIAVFPFRRH